MPVIIKLDQPMNAVKPRPRAWVDGEAALQKAGLHDGGPALRDEPEGAARNTSAPVKSHWRTAMAGLARRVLRVAEMEFLRVVNLPGMGAWEPAIEAEHAAQRGQRGMLDAPCFFCQLRR